MPPSPSQGHGGLEENKAAKAFPVSEEGPSHGKPLGTLYLFPFLFLFIYLLLFFCSDIFLFFYVQDI